MRPRRLVRVLIGTSALLAMLAFALTSCPSNRDGVTGQLATAKDETLSAARSGVLALDLWAQQRSTGDLTGVQLTDARDEVVKAYRTIAVLEADRPADLGRQVLLTRTMTEVIGTLNDAAAAVRAVVGQPDPRVLRHRLIVGAEALERGYR